MEGSGSGQIITDPDPGGTKTYGSGTVTLSMDPPDGRAAGGGISCGGGNSLVSNSRPLRHTSGPAQRAWNKVSVQWCSRFSNDLVFKLSLLCTYLLRIWIAYWCSWVYLSQVFRSSWFDPEKNCPPKSSFLDPDSLNPDPDSDIQTSCWSRSRLLLYQDPFQIRI